MAGSVAQPTGADICPHREPERLLVGVKAMGRHKRVAWGRARLGHGGHPRLDKLRSFRHRGSEAPGSREKKAYRRRHYKAFRRRVRQFLAQFPLYEAECLPVYRRTSGWLTW